MSNKPPLLLVWDTASIQLVTATTHTDAQHHILPGQTQGCWIQDLCQTLTPCHPTLLPWWHHCKAMNHWPRKVRKVNLCCTSLIHKAGLLCLYCTSSSCIKVMWGGGCFSASEQAVQVVTLQSQHLSKRSEPQKTRFSVPQLLPSPNFYVNFRLRFGLI